MYAKEKQWPSVLLIERIIRRMKKKPMAANISKEQGYEYKDGRQPSIRGKGQKCWNKRKNGIANTRK